MRAEHPNPAPLRRDWGLSGSPNAQPAVLLPHGFYHFRRLHRILALKQMGYGLTDIHDVLDNVIDPLTILDRQAQLLDAQARRAKALSATLEDVARRFGNGCRC